MAPRALAVQLQHLRPIGVGPHHRLPLHPEVLTEAVLEEVASEEAAWVVVAVPPVRAVEVIADKYYTNPVRCI